MSETKVETGELKACPFCGGKAEASGFFVSDEMYGVVSCQTCRAEIEVRESIWDGKTNVSQLKACAINGWNRRAGNQFRDVTKMVGNAAKLREALERLTDFWEKHGCAYSVQVAPIRESEKAVEAERIRVMAKAKAVLAVPPRNCDMFATAEEALEEFNRVYFGPTEPEFVGEAFIRWLFATAGQDAGGVG